jgi:hypothetical protein
MVSLLRTVIAVLERRTWLVMLARAAAEPLVVPEIQGLVPVVVQRSLMKVNLRAAGVSAAVVPVVKILEFRASLIRASAAVVLETIAPLGAVPVRRLLTIDPTLARGRVPETAVTTSSNMALGARAAVVSDAAIAYAKRLALAAVILVGLVLADTGFVADQRRASARSPAVAVARLEPVVLGKAVVVREPDARAASAALRSVACTEYGAAAVAAEVLKARRADATSSPAYRAIFDGRWGVIMI